MSVNFAPATRRPTPAAMLAQFDDMPAEILFMEEDLMVINMHVGGAAKVLAALGLRPDGEEMLGECTAQDFLGRVLVALAVEPEDAGMPSYESSPNWFECARPEGYVQRHLENLRKLAEFCIENGMLVAWG